MKRGGILASSDITIENPQIFVAAESENCVGIDVNKELVEKDGGVMWHRHFFCEKFKIIFEIYELMSIVRDGKVTLSAVMNYRPVTGKREDRTDYTLAAIREAIINALVHRDYSFHTEGMSIQLIMFEDRIRATNIEFICTGHCTKDHAFGILKEELGDIVHQIKVGYEIRI